MGRKAKELPSKISNLPAYKKPRGAIRHDEVWAKAQKLSRTSSRVTVEFDKDRDAAIITVY